jgi:hypothetical protein
LVSILLYNLIGLFETNILKRFAPQAWKSR